MSKANVFPLQYPYDDIVVSISLWYFKGGKGTEEGLDFYKGRLPPLSTSPWVPSELIKKIDK